MAKKSSSLTETMKKLEDLLLKEKESREQANKFYEEAEKSRTEAEELALKELGEEHYQNALSLIENFLDDVKPTKPVQKKRNPPKKAEESKPVDKKKEPEEEKSNKDSEVVVSEEANKEELLEISNVDEDNVIVTNNEKSSETVSTKEVKEDETSSTKDNNVSDNNDNWENEDFKIDFDDFDEDVPSFLKD